MENRISSSLPPAVNAAQTAALSAESPSAQDAAPMATELTAIGHHPIPSLASLQIGQESTVPAAAYLRSAPVRTQTEDIARAAEDMKEAVRKGERDPQDKERIKNYGMLERKVDDPHPPPDTLNRVEKMETAKVDLCNAVRRGIFDHRGVVVPASFLALDEDDRRDVVRLTVSWVFSPVNRSTHQRFECLVAAESLQPYLKDTVPQDTYDEAARIGLSLVCVNIEAYRMLVAKRQEQRRIEAVAADFWREVLDGIANGWDAKTPGSFAGLSKEEKHEVARLLVARLLPVRWTSFENHFNRLTVNEDLKPYLADTLSQSEADEISLKMKIAGSDALSHVTSRIDEYGMVTHHDEGPVQQATNDVWDAVRDGVSKGHHASTPASFTRLSSDDKQAAVNGAIGKLCFVHAWQIEAHFNCLAANPDVNPYLRGAMTKAQYSAIQRRLKFFTNLQVWLAVSSKMEDYRLRG